MIFTKFITFTENSVDKVKYQKLRNTGLITFLFGVYIPCVDYIHLYSFCFDQLSTILSAPAYVAICRPWQASLFLLDTNEVMWLAT